MRARLRIVVIVLYVLGCIGFFGTWVVTDGFRPSLRDADRIRVGMSAEEVARILGPPAHRDSLEPFEHGWRRDYDLRDGTVGIRFDPSGRVRRISSRVEYDVLHQWYNRIGRPPVPDEF